MSKLSEPLNDFGDRQIQNSDNVLAKPYSGNCIFCAKQITEQDDDHSVCNICWTKLGEEK